ncbi:MAG: glycosyltransferase [Paracoccus sp. (in: a-proteobacteria)]|uniref:glycosyltransferase n=1 Tax=Paracoccus sp. TaxID=267 RepID=UPI0026DF9F1F|nr:glycosyltransferase [Paracoccus sp. (in: a-proteobacteria)]MDO5620112.1 glycosyltransferase [Paracoccus sp. (in: a-proteobacteria)]
MISCIIPAYNEGPRIRAVAALAVAHPQIAEVIVVDDGSRDDTAAQAAEVRGLRLIRQPRNMGKTAAVARGIHEARGDLILLLDADLIGLTTDDLTALIAPVTAGRADMSISLRGNTPAPWRWIGLDYISGERVLSRNLLAPHLDRLNALPRFGLEVFMNQLLVQAPLRLAVVGWPEVKSPLKSAKLGLWRGLRADMAMIADMMRTHGPLRLARQIIAMRRMRVTS